jgi:hypothetical protein
MPIHARDRACPTFAARRASAAALLVALLVAGLAATAQAGLHQWSSGGPESTGRVAVRTQ